MGFQEISVSNSNSSPVLPPAVVKPPDDMNAGTAYVFADFVFDDGLLFISVENYSKTKPAKNVNVAFDVLFSGVGGTKPMNSLPLFREIAFLAPGKRISTFLDTSASYFTGGQPTQFNVTVIYKDLANTKYITTTKHDINLYRQIGYVRRSEAPDGMDTLDRCKEE